MCVLLLESLHIQFASKTKSSDKPLMLIELKCLLWSRDEVPFRVEILTDAINHLIIDALQAYRVYELMSIRRPGDVWKYVWVKLLDVPRSVQESVAYRKEEFHRWGNCTWPNQHVPLNLFDKCFYFAWDDTEPESSTWLRERRGKRFQDVADQLFAKVRKAQEELRASVDLLIQAELDAMDLWQHYSDHDADPLFQLTTPDYLTCTAPARTLAYYEKLRELLLKPEVINVAVRNDTDFHTLRIVCTEQRRRTILTGKPVGHDMPIHVLSDGYPTFSCWGARIAEWQEGLGYGDLVIDAECNGASIAWLVNNFDYRRRTILTHMDQGELLGFHRSAGEGWVLYEDQTPDTDYPKQSEKHRQEFIKA